jgi:hypothetical protein
MSQQRANRRAHPIAACAHITPHQSIVINRSMPFSGLGPLGPEYARQSWHLNHTLWPLLALRKHAAEVAFAGKCVRLRKKQSRQCRLICVPHLRKANQMTQTDHMNDSRATAVQPDVAEAHWDLEQVDNLFEDLQQGADVQHVQVRTGSAEGPRDRVVTLNRAHELLRSGEAKAIQIRYEFDEKSWCDTLMVGAADVRIIRTQLC